MSSCWVGKGKMSYLIVMDMVSLGNTSFLAINSRFYKSTIATI
jgi:hypothetical protein